MSTPTQPESPPVKVAKGLSTYAGLAGAAGAVLPVAIAALTDERIDASTRRLLIIVGAGLLAVVIIARAAQAIASEFARGPDVALLERAEDAEPPEDLQAELRELKEIAKRQRAEVERRKRVEAAAEAEAGERRAGTPPIAGDPYAK